MNEKEFKKLNERLRQQQAQATKKHEKQSAVKNSEIYSTLLNKIPEPKRKCQRCNKEDCELVEVDYHELIRPYIYKYLCHECESKRQNYIIAETNRLRREKRENRVLNIHRKLDKIIPPSYRQARLWRLGTRFKEKLLKYDPHTGLVLYGPVGCGKTFAICALLRSILGSSINKKYYPICERICYEMLCLQIRDSFKSNSDKSELDVIRPYLEPQILAIEESWQQQTYWYCGIRFQLARCLCSIG